MATRRYRGKYRPRAHALHSGALSLRPGTSTTASQRLAQPARPASSGSVWSGDRSPAADPLAGPDFGQVSTRFGPRPPGHHSLSRWTPGGKIMAVRDCEVDKGGIV